MTDDDEEDEEEDEVEALAAMAGLDCRSGVKQDNPVAVTAASMGSASPKTHLYLAPAGKSGSVRIVSWTCESTTHTIIYHQLFILSIF